MSTHVAFEWPTYPVLTKTGKVSQAKNAGKNVPWLSANVINNLPRPVYQNAKHLWHEAARKAAEGKVYSGKFPILFDIVLWKRTAKVMDNFAILEGCKPIIDGFVDAGYIPDDGPEFVLGGIATGCKAESGQKLGVSLIAHHRWHPGDY